jgi:23S rRNA (cytidine1920-2'-O)/16S rRNA (cytidine1409-2'-O)-methyltransferase
MAKGTRLDTVLVERGLFETRRQAQSAIMAGEVRINDHVASKPAVLVRELATITVAQRNQFVGRGGLKLAGALDHFQIPCAGKTALDIGASTGGFTDCLLQRGVDRVYAVDVGHGQLAWKIRTDPRVIVLERLNARQLSHEQIPEPIDVCVIDVSFISLTLILPNAFELLTPSGVMLALIKPQFELQRQDVGRGGIVRSSELHAKAQQKISSFVENLGHVTVGIVPSQLTGADGNQEFFICLRRRSD